MDSEAGTPGSMTVGALRFGGFELDLVEEVLWRGGVRANINPRTFQVLRLLVDRRGEIVSKEEFFEKVWGGTFVEENNLTVTITALRKALSDSAKDPRFIENVPRKGYRFVAEVTRLPVDAEGVPGNALNSDSFSSSFDIVKRRGRTVFVVLTALFIAVLMLAGAAAIRYRQSASAPDDSQPRFNSLAIIPFASETGAEYVAEGVTDEIAARLLLVPGARVIGNGHTAKYRGRAIDVVATGRELNAAAVLIGRVAVAEAQVTVSGELYNSSTGERVWNREFKAPAGELLDLQRELGDAVAQVVSSAGREPLPTSIHRVGTTNREAYELFLKGRYYWNKRTIANIDRSADLFKAAIDKDPTFARAYVALAKAYSTADLSGRGINDRERFTLVNATIDRALEIDPDLGEAYASRGINNCFLGWQLKAAEADYRRALELSPRDPTAMHWYAELLAMLGRFDESLAVYERAMAADPLSMPIRTDHALTFYYARDFDKAIELLTKASQVDPSYARTYDFLFLAYREKGMYHEAIDAMRKRLELNHKNGDLTAKQFAEYSARLDKMQGSLRNGSRDFWLGTAWNGEPYFTAVAYAKLGEKEKAFEYLERAFETRYTGMVWLKVTPELDSLRDDPRFADLLRRVGFD